MTNGAGKPKPAFFIAVLVVVAGLIVLAYMRCRSSDKKTETTDGSGSAKVGSAGSAGSGGKPTQVEATGPVDGLTAKSYEYDPATTLPPVPGTSGYKSIGKDRVVRFAVNTWAGWAPIVWANGGHKPGKKWKSEKGDFQVELILADDPVSMLNVYAAGETQIGWATVDMLPLMVGRLEKDRRTMPRVFQQIDWSNGGDGIVVRKDINQVSDLKGKTITLAQNSPSHFFLLNMLQNGGLKPSEVTMKFMKDPFQAAQAYNSEKDIQAVVSWAPDIYTLTDNPAIGNKMLVNTQTANKLIADVWFARADFARDHPDIVEGLVKGIFDAIQDLSTSEPNKNAVGTMMDAFYKLPAGTGVKMLGDAHWTNWGENRDFFLVETNPTNFERTYKTAKTLYGRAITHEIDFDQLVDFSIVKKLGNDPKYAAQKNTYEYAFTPKSGKDINVEAAFAKKSVTISFYPNSYDIWKKVPPKSGGGPDVYFDGNIEFTIEEIAKTAGQFGTARIVISGHTDTSMKGTADPNLVKELSENRAKAVKDGLLKRFPKLDPNQLVATGHGWEKPADPADPENHTKNRRVEVRVIPAEAQ